MKKLIIVMLALLALSGLAAVQLKYWTSEVYLQTIPRLMSDSSVLTKAATVFTPPVDADLEGVYFPFYKPGALGEGNVLIEIWPVDANGLPDESGFFPLASATILYADLIDWNTAPAGEDYNYVDFSASNLAFGPTGTNGTKFAMVMTCPNGLLPNIKTATMHDSTVSGSSWNYYTVVEPVGWDQWYDYCFTAEVTYLGDQIDVEPTSLWFTGDFFLAPGEAVTYEADVINNSVNSLGTPIAVTGVDVALVLWDYAYTDPPLYLEFFENQSFAASEERHFIFPELTLPLTGRNILQLQAWHDLDVVSGNNNLFLQQDVLDLTAPAVLAYDEDQSSMAHAYYEDGAGWANSFWYYESPLKITSISFEMRDNTWPTGALGNLEYAIFPDDGTGYPDMANPLVPITATTCTLGAWNTYDVSSYNINIPAGETFYVAYFQVGAYQAGAPGLLGDMTDPISSWLTSYSYYMDDTSTWIWETPNATDEDMCIRATVELGVAGTEAPIISIALDSGYPTVTWAAVTGALSYNVYGSNNPVAAQPWTPLATGIADLGYQYTGTAAYEFFYVTASNMADGSKLTLDPKKMSSKPEIAPLPKSVIRELKTVPYATDRVK